MLIVVRRNDQNSLFIWLYEGGEIKTPEILFTDNLILKESYHNSLFSHMMIDRKGRIWMAFYGEGVFCFEWKNGALRELNRYLTDAKKFDTPSYVIYDIIQDSQDRIWFGTTKGIYRYDEATDQMRFVEVTGNKTAYSFCQESGDRYRMLTINIHSRVILY